MGRMPLRSYRDLDKTEAQTLEAWDVALEEALAASDLQRLAALVEVAEQQARRIWEEGCQ